MRAQHTAMRRAVIVSALVLAGVAGSRAGDLNPPPGPVSPTMKSLTSVEPRVEVNATNTPGSATAVYVIRSAGSYYLSGNVGGQSGKQGIAIAASNVSLDLNGFSLLGVPGSLAGIGLDGSVAEVRGLTIANGTISGWGGAGVDGQAFWTSRLEDLTVTGCSSVGLAAGEGSVISRCLARGNGLVGVFGNGAIIIERCTATQNLLNGIQPNAGSTIRDCLAVQNTGVGIFGPEGSVVTGCRSLFNTLAGIEVGEHSRVQDCESRLNSGAGIFAERGTSVSGCVVSENGMDGIEAWEECLIESCTASDNGDDGISFKSGSLVRGNTSSGNFYGFYDAGSAGSRVDENMAHSNDYYGFLLLAGAHHVVRNTGRSNGTEDIAVSGTSSCGELVLSGGTIGAATGAWANFVQTINAASSAATSKSGDKRSTVAPLVTAPADGAKRGAAGLGTGAAGTTIINSMR